MRLTDAIDLFRDARLGEGVALNTRLNESRTLRRFASVVMPDTLEALAPEDVSDYFALRRAEGISPSTLNLELWNLRAFFRHAVAMGWVAEGFNPVAGRRSAKVAQRERLRIPPEQFRSLLMNAGSARNRIVVALGIYLMLRESEIPPLRWGDYNPTALTLTVRVKKSGLVDEMPVSAELGAELEAWRGAWFEREGRHPQGDDPLVPAYTPQGVIRGAWAAPHFAVHDTLRTLGYNADGEGMHTLRRSASRALFDRLSDEGYDYALQVVKEMLHHSSVTTTERYLGVTASRTKRDALIAGRRVYA